MGQKQQWLRKRHTSVLWVKNIWVYMFQFIRGVTISGLETENGNPLHLFAVYVSTIIVWCFIMWLLERQEGSELHIPMGFIKPFSAVEVENKLQALDTWHPSYMLDTSGDHTHTWDPMKSFLIFFPNSILFFTQFHFSSFVLTFAFNFTIRECV